MNNLKEEIKKIKDENKRILFLSYLKKKKIVDKQIFICDIIVNNNDILEEFLNIFENSLPPEWTKEVLLNYIGYIENKN
jgi:hypothetical protein